MSEQVRFKIEGCKVNPDLASICITFVKDENGEYVRYEDYARLKAEVERLQKVASVNKCAAEAVRFSYEQAKIEVERLRKAGDAMALGIEGDYNYTMPCVQAWNAAKEGKPSV